MFYGGGFGFPLAFQKGAFGGFGSRLQRNRLTREQQSSAEQRESSAERHESGQQDPAAQAASTLFHSAGPRAIATHSKAGFLRGCPRTVERGTSSRFVIQVDPARGSESLAWPSDPGGSGTLLSRFCTKQTKCVGTVGYRAKNLYGVAQKDGTKNISDGSGWSKCGNFCVPSFCRTPYTVLPFRKPYQHTWFGSCKNATERFPWVGSAWRF